MKLATKSFEISCVIFFELKIGSSTIAIDNIKYIKYILKEEIKDIYFSKENLVHFKVLSSRESFDFLSYFHRKKNLISDCF